MYVYKQICAVPVNPAFNTVSDLRAAVGGLKPDQNEWKIPENIFLVIYL